MAINVKKLTDCSIYFKFNLKISEPIIGTKQSGRRSIRWLLPLNFFPVNLILEINYLIARMDHCCVYHMYLSYFRLISGRRVGFRSKSQNEPT